MEENYYITSDGSIMEIESFVTYIYHLKSTVTHFSFCEWFCEADFSDFETYDYLINTFQK